MKTIKIRKGYDLPISGEPVLSVAASAQAERVASLPEKIPFIKPRLQVKEGDAVQIGSVLFEDKRTPAVKFLSPGGGQIAKIRFGKRRVIKEIIIDLDAQEQQVRFKSLPSSEIGQMMRADLVDAILKGGLWSLFRGLPFYDYPDPESIPPAIIVNLDTKEPFQPSPEAYLKARTDLLNYGIQVLNKLCDTVYLTVTDTYAASEQWKDLTTHAVAGPYPAGDPGVSLYHIKKSAQDNRAWTISGQNLLLLADLLKNGRYPIERTIVVAGIGAPFPQHISTRIGIPLEQIAGISNSAATGKRYITGGVFNGYRSNADAYLGFLETSLTILPEGDSREMFGFARPGLKKPSHSRAFLSAISKAQQPMDCGMHGELRACVQCGYCADVCAVDILPQFTLKSILAGEVEEALSHGLLDCVSCGLCTYVCPCKIEIQVQLQAAKDLYYKEIY
jgi:Na+-transporting NADH:ubiquinone oxidoreductase subunit A